jgi:hypothetical protein
MRRVFWGEQVREAVVWSCSSKVAGQRGRINVAAAVKSEKGDGRARSSINVKEKLISTQAAYPLLNAPARRNFHR